MIVTDLEHIAQQAPMTPFMDQAVAFLRQPNIEMLPEGTVEIDDRRVFAIIQRYETVLTGEPKFEYHQKYIDVQLVVSGEEIIGWVPRDRMKITEPYDSGRDICFGVAASRAVSLIHLQAGQLAVLYPDDGHAPKLAAGVSSPVMKIVVKVVV
jgi:YhcH/YjgK/YiaL family protein